MNTERICFPELPEGPDYEVAPLKYDEIRVAVAQMNPQPVDPDDPKKGINANVDHMLDLCDAAVCWPPDPKGVQLICFPEFSLTAYDTGWTRSQWMDIAIQVPGGPEVERIGAKAKEHGMYIAFASHTQDADWPGHFFNCSVIVSPAGEVVHTHWKAYFGFPGCAEYSTTVHDVMDEFLERYGWDAVWPVCRTEIGNIGTTICSEAAVPETARVLAMCGTEILVEHTANGHPPYEFPFISDGVTRMRSDCSANHVWGIYADSRANHIKVGGAHPWESGLGGGTMLLDPFGRVIASALDSTEHVLHTTIPIASYRKKHLLPRVRQEIYLPILERTVGPCPPNMYADQLPDDLNEALERSMERMPSPQPAGS